MSPKNEAQETSRHWEQRRLLHDLESSIENLDVHKLDVTRLKELNVNLGTSALKPHFFAPRHDDLPQPSDKILDEFFAPDPWPSSDGTASEDPYQEAYATHIFWESYAFHDVNFLDSAPWRSKDPGDYTPFGSLYQYDAPEFGAFDTADVAGGQYPHFKAVIYNGLEADNETCFRGELLIILRLMLGQLRKIRLLHHNIAPVLLVSLAGKRARVLEAYFDEGSQSLVVRSSELYEVSDRTSASKTFITLAEYFLGDPAGNTV
ncbi:hypothetical protein N7524_005440 [Penicillium chrysogenum]|nr:hypothetical protein N7524_005440 [Penicillium chrysogenum]